MESSEKDIVAIIDFVCYALNLATICLSSCYVDPERCKWGEGR